MGKMTSVFVYGLLRTGGSLNYVMGGQTKLADAVTKPEYVLVATNSHQYLLETAEIRDATGLVLQGESIVGEIWEVDNRKREQLAGMNYGTSLLTVELTGNLKARAWQLTPKCWQWLWVVKKIREGYPILIKDILAQGSGK